MADAKGITSGAAASGGGDTASYPAQETAPAAVAGSAQVYSKDVAGTGGPNLLMHFDDNITDSGSMGATISHPGAYNGAPAYVSSGKFSSAIHFDSATWGDFLTIPAHADLQWDGDFTVDFWMKWQSVAQDGQRVCIISPDVSVPTLSYHTTVNVGMFLGWIPEGANYERSFELSLAKTAGTGNLSFDHATARFQYYGDGTNDAHVSDSDLTSQFHHVAICRTNKVVEMWLNGIKLTQNYLYNSESATELVTDATINGANDAYYLGRDRFYASSTTDNKTTHQADLQAYMDELRMVKGAAKFSGATFTPPASAYSATVPDVTKMFVMDSSGAETQLG